MAFEGVLFTGPGGMERLSCKVDFEKYQLKVEAKDHSLHFSYSQLRISFGGSSNHLVFFETVEKSIHDSEAKVVFYIPKSPALSSAIQNFGTPEMQELVSRESKRRGILRAIVFAAVTLFAVGAVAAYMFRASATKTMVNLIPYSLEQKVGEKLFPNVVPAYLLVKDNELTVKLEKMLEPVRLAMPQQFQSIKVHISNSEELNAYAFPGGYIVFNIGALRAAKTGLEILGVAAHELAHVTERHVVRNIMQGAGLFVVIQTLLGDLTGIIAVIVDQGGFLLSRNFSRSMEDEADRVGFNRMVDAGLDPRGMAAFFELLIASQPEVQKNLEKGLEFLSTHPDTESRIKSIHATYESLSTEVKARLKDKVEGFNELKEQLSKYKE